ncbi:DnaJ-like protein [Vanrija albida]|uniref:DnaJ-like protein n=1 Tax=Vanrija albida TaxID=181172 RepID=A0ABR3QD67_9TREE
MSTIVDARPRGAYTPADCPECRSAQEYAVPPTYIGNLRIRCSECKALFQHPQPRPGGAGVGSKTSAGASASARSGPAAGGSRRPGIGTDANPIDMAYYDVLGISATATTDEIKKSYRRLAIKLHPDKNRDDPDAEEKFKLIAVAYQVLSDPDQRKKYNEFGQKNGGGGNDAAFQDPEEVFGKMFGGDRFEDLIGSVSIGKDMKDVFQQQHEEESLNEYMIGPNGKPVLTPEAQARKTEREKQQAEEKAKERQDRVDKLAANLVRKISVFTEAARGADDPQVGPSFKEICRLEAEDLKDESFGVELLHSLGRTYQSRASQHLATATFAPLGWFHGAKNTFNQVTDTVSTLRAALDLKAVFEKLQAAEQSGVSPEELRKLEEQATEQGMRVLWKGAKLEVESVVRETCDKVLSDPNVSREKRDLRASALNLMGEAFLSVKKGEEGSNDEFVKIETAASKQRDAARAAGSGSPGKTPVPDHKPPPAYATYESKRKQ